LKQAFALKSFLATQDIEQAELWLWLDGREAYDGWEHNPFLRPLLPFIRVKHFDPESESAETALQGRPELYSGRPAARSDFFRLIVLYNHGGTYVDMDMMFLRDLGPLLGSGLSHEEFCYQWSSHMPFGNSAVLRLRQRSATAATLLAKCAAGGHCHPRNTLAFAENNELDLLVLPCFFFDPLWPHNDREDVYEGAPFSRFRHFYRKFGLWFRRRSDIHSHKDFFPGAFMYHYWHNLWDAREHKDSYFGLFNSEFNRIVESKLGIPTAALTEVPALGPAEVS
jgi:hypothetical protein